MASSSSSDPLGSLTGFLASFAQNDDRYQRMVSGSGSPSQYADILEGADSLLEVHSRMLPDPRSLPSVHSCSTRTRTIAPSQIFTDFTGDSASFSENSSVTGPADVPEPVGQNQDGGPLVLFCEFAWLNECDTSFQQHDFWAWVEHIEVEHFQRRLPESCRCWFCDDVKFKASRHNGDRRNNFYQRMGHIYSHIVESRETAEQMVNQVRPDFDILKHLRRNNLVDERVYLQALQFEEGPTVSGTYPHDFIPPEQLKASSGRNQILVLEEKRERRARRPMHHSASRHDGSNSRHNGSSSRRR